MPTPTPYDNFRLNIRYYRLQNEWSLEDLAERAEISKDTLWRFEVGRHPEIWASTLLKIAAALGVRLCILEEPLNDTQREFLEKRRVTTPNGKFTSQTGRAASRKHWEKG